MAAVATEVAPAALAGMAGGVFPDPDPLAGIHRRTLHFPAYYWALALGAGYALCRKRIPQLSGRLPSALATAGALVVRVARETRPPLRPVSVLSAGESRHIRSLRRPPASVADRFDHSPSIPIADPVQSLAADPRRSLPSTSDRYRVPASSSAAMAAQVRSESHFGSASPAAGSSRSGR